MSTWAEVSEQGRARTAARVGGDNVLNLIIQIQRLIFSNYAPFHYSGDRGGVPIAEPGFVDKTPQINALKQQLMSMPGVNYSAINDEFFTSHHDWFDHLSDAFATVVQGVVIAGIGVGLAGVAGAGPAATGGSSGATATTAAGGNVGVAAGSTVIAPSTTAAGSAGIGAGASGVAAGGGGVSYAALATNAGISAGVSKLIAKVGSIITPRSESTTTTAVPFSGGGSGSSTSSGGSGSSGPNYVLWIMGAFALFLGFIFLHRR